MRFVCSRIDESVELSNQFNQMINPETGRFFRTIALNGDATNKTNADQIFDTERTEKIDKADGKMQPLADVKWLPADVTLIEKIGEALYETKNSKEYGIFRQKSEVYVKIH